jgi:hypothetical protein
VCFSKKIINGIQKDINGRRTTRQKRQPPPSVIFAVQQVVHGNDRHTDRHNAQNDIHQQHKTINKVKFVIPKTSKNKPPEKLKKRKKKKIKKKKVSVKKFQEKEKTILQLST